MLVHAVLLLYMILSVLDQLLVTMADPEQQLRDAATAVGVDLMGLSSEAIKSEVDAGRAALSSHLSRLPQGQVPTTAARFEELKLVVGPVAQRAPAKVKSQGSCHWASTALSQDADARGAGAG